MFRLALYSSSLYSVCSIIPYFLFPFLPCFLHFHLSLSQYPVSVSVCPSILGTSVSCPMLDLSGLSEGATMDLIEEMTRESTTKKYRVRTYPSLSLKTWNPISTYEKPRILCSKTFHRAEQCRGRFFSCTSCTYVVDDKWNERQSNIASTALSLLVRHPVLLTFLHPLIRPPACLKCVLVLCV